MTTKNKTNYKAAHKLCNICGEGPAVYEKVCHCKQCHSDYNKDNAKLHRHIKKNKKKKII